MSKPDPELRRSLISHLRSNHRDMCRAWFDDIEPVALSNGVLRLCVREPVQLRYLQRCCVEPFTEAAQAATGLLVAVRFVSPEDCENDNHDVGSSSNQSHGGRISGSGTNQDGIDLAAEQMVLSPDYVFDNFIVGPGNRLALMAANAVAEKPGRAYNPYFIHGGVGLGKTHLLQAICQRILRDRTDASICYISCSTFMDLFHECVKAGRMQDFRHHFRTADVLVIDDIHFLSKHDQSQEEFFHTFNALYQSGRQIVLSSDAAPSEIPDLEERLVSRFNCGLVARIERPCYETRVAILKAKAALHDLELPDDVPAYIAARLDSNIRELEGALTKIRGYSLAEDQAITLELAKRALADDPTRQVGDESAAPSIQAIIDSVTRYYDVKLTDLLSKRRHKSITVPRQVCMWLARRHTRFSLEEIGGYFGGRDHTTVMHAIRAINRRRDEDSSFSDDIDRLETSVLDRAPS
ncbi:MAG: chromosomal replication initiator protein DnaA [Planctomycetaceae bacterium]|nr:chromosomal replication initiator protein DnaA [Planctomycetaceae bacterium]